MAVKLKWITPQAEHEVVHIARVSNPKAQAEGHNPAKLIRYLVANGHWSPLQMAYACFEIETPRDIARQMLRHDFDFQEFSQRYEDATQLGEFALRECRMQDSKNRQSSWPTTNAVLVGWWQSAQKSILNAVLETYKDALARGIAKEVARVILPEGLTPSRLYMCGSMRSWFHYVCLRTMDGTQKEHREVALEILAILREECPVIFSEAAIKREQDKWTTARISDVQPKSRQHPSIISGICALPRYFRDLLEPILKTWLKRLTG